MGGQCTIRWSSWATPPSPPNTAQVTTADPCANQGVLRVITTARLSWRTTASQCTIREAFLVAIVAPAPQVTWAALPILALQSDTVGQCTIRETSHVIITAYTAQVTTADLYANRGAPLVIIAARSSWRTTAGRHTIQSASCVFVTALTSQAASQSTPVSERGNDNEMGKVEGCVRDQGSVSTPLAPLTRRPQRPRPARGGSPRRIPLPSASRNLALQAPRIQARPAA